MADNKGKLIGTFEIEDELEIEEVNEFIESLTDGKVGSFILTNKWSEGRIEVRKRVNQELSDVGDKDE